MEIQRIILEVWDCVMEKFRDLGVNWCEEKKYGIS